MNRFFFSSVCLLVSFAAAMLTAPAAAQRRGGSPTPNVAISQVVEQEIQVSQPFVGTVMPSRTALIGSAVGGRVVEFPHNEGDRIEAGQTLAQLLTETMQLELQAAEAELEFRKQELMELQNGFRPEEIEQAQARMLAAKAARDYQAARRDRAQSLFQRGQALTAEERDSIISLAVEAEQNFVDAREAYELAVAGPRKERIAQSAARVDIQEAVVEQLRDRIRKHTIVSRFAGYIVAEHTEVGQWVGEGDAVAQVIALDQVDVLVQVVEQYIPYVRVGMPVEVEVQAFPDRPFAGEVALIVPQADVRARTFPVKVRIDNEISADGPLLKAGMVARMMLPTGSRQMARLVHKDAIVLGGPRPTVYVVEGSPSDNRGTVRQVAVSLGDSVGEMIQVGNELARGERIVVQGNEGLRNGQEVIISRVIAPPAEAVSQTGS